MVTGAAAVHVLDDDVEVEHLDEALRSARRTLYLTVVGAVHTGMSETEATRRAGVDQMTVRKLLGKR